MVDEAEIILESGKCLWSKCIFCPFAVKDIRKKSLNELKREFDEKLEKVSKAKRLKIFSSGSFLDDSQMPAELRKHIIKRCLDHGIEELVVESLPQFVTEKRLKELKSMAGDKLKITFAIGLEIADDEIMRKIGKPFRLKDYEKATALLRQHGFGVRTYLMVNLPFVKDIRKSLHDSIAYAKEHSDSVALINTFPRPKTELFRLWMDGKWRPLSKEEFDELVSKYVDGKKVQAYYHDYVCPPRIPKKEREFIKGVGREYLVHKHFEIWQDYISRIYEVPKIKKYALFLPCSYRKPYSRSKTHRAILSRLMSLKSYPYIHQLMISNAGVVPREFENEYPFNSYDWEEWRETDEIKKEYYEVTKRRIENYLVHKGKNYKKIFSYLKPDSLSYRALMDAAEKLKIKIVDCVDAQRYEELKLQNVRNPLIDRTLLDEMTSTIKREVDEEQNK